MGEKIKRTNKKIKGDLKKGGILGFGGMEEKALV